MREWSVSQRRALVISLTSLAVVLALVFHFRAMSGVPAFVLNADDGYIHAHIADNLARTGVLGLNPGVQSGGSSSLPWTLLLAALVEFGVSADRGAWLLSLVFWGLSALSGLLLISALLPRGAAWWVAGFGLVASGHLLAVSLSGLEAPLFLFCVLTSLLCQHEGKWVRAALWAALAVSTRPEGILLAVTVVLVALSRRQPLSAIRREGWRALLLPAASFASLAVTLSVLRAMGGELPSTLEGRRWLAELPRMPWDHPDETIRASKLFVWSLGHRLSQYIGPRYLPGVVWSGMLLSLAGVGWIAMLRGGGVSRRIAVYIVLHFLFFLLLLPTPGQLGRYLTPIWALLPMVATMGWLVVRSWGPIRRIPGAAVIVPALMVAGYVPHVIRWSGWHAGAIHHMSSVHRAAAQWAAGHIDVAEPIAAFDIGLLGWTVPHRIVDLGGITGRESLESIRRGDVPALLEKEGVRYVILPEFLDEQRWHVAGLLQFPVEQLEELRRFALTPDEIDHVWPTIIACPALGIYRWLGPGNGDNTFEPRT